MTTTSTRSAHRLGLLVASILLPAALLLLPSTAFGDPTTVTPPPLPGVAALPGPTVDPGKPAADMKVLKTVPDTALAGVPVTISGSGLPASSRHSGTSGSEHGGPGQSGRFGYATRVPRCQTRSIAGRVSRGSRWM